MSTTPAAPAQYTQPSRKGKKAWRKNVDISEVQQGLEEAREEVIHGGIIKEKTADELYVVDPTGSEEIKKQHLKYVKSLKSDSVIAERASAVPGLSGRKRRSVLADELPVKRTKKNTYIPDVEVRRLRASAANGEERKTILQEGVDRDPWEEPVKERDPQYSFLEEKHPIREPATLKHKPVSLAASGKAVPAVKRPEGGKSYNPQYEEWQELLDRTGEKEVEAERRRLEEAREEAERTERALLEAAKPDPPSEDEYESAWESEWEGIQSGKEDEEQQVLSRKQPQRKTQAERNKIKRRKELERAEKHAQQMKKRQEQELRIKQIAKELRQRDAQKEAQIAKLGHDEVDTSDEEDVLRRRRFGKGFIPESPLEVVLADELQDSLRALKPEGNLLKDRYRNLFINGKLETRTKTQHKKAKRTRTEKWTYKDFKV